MRRVRVLRNVGPTMDHDTTARKDVRRTIAVIGGGFAGVALLRRLQPWLSRDWRAVIISDKNYMTYTPLLPEVVSASILPGHAIAAIRQLVAPGSFIRGRVHRIDMERRTISYRNDRARRLHYDHLVLACGVSGRSDIVPGMAEHGLALKTPGDALFLRNHLLRRLEEAEQEPDPVIRAALLRFVVIGGGSTGVETAGAIRDFLREAAHYYPRICAGDADVVLLEAGAFILSEFPPSLAVSALHTMRRHGIHVRTQTRIERVTPEGVVHHDGALLPTRNVICTIGYTAGPLVETLGLPTTRGRVVTNSDMSVSGHRNIWAIGDCAWIPNAHDGEHCPPMAQFAVRQGHQLANNLVAAIASRPTRAFHYRPRGHLATVGHHRAVALIYGVRASGFVAWLIWRAVYLAMLPTRLRKIQVFFEWTLSMFFRQDVNELDLQRSTTVAGAQPALVHEVKRSRLSAADVEYQARR